MKYAVAAYVLLLCSIWLIVSHAVALPAPSLAVPPAEQAAALARLRAIVDGKSAPPPFRFQTWRGVATLWCGGRIEQRADLRAGEGGLAVDGFVATQQHCSIKVDVIDGRAPIPGVAAAIDPLLAVSLVPGVDGLGLDFGGREVLLTPDELLAGDYLAGHRPLPGVDFEVGLDGRAALRALAARAGASPATWRATPHHLFRFRTVGFVESPRGPLPTLRGNPPGPPPTRADLRRAARDGGDYLVRHLHDLPDGGARFDYEYYPGSDQATSPDGDYSLARHAGAALYLAQLAGATRDPAYADAARRAILFLVGSAPAGCDTATLACVGETRAAARTVDLGTSALSLAAAAEYERATGDARFRGWARRLAAFLVAMQKPNGDFCHLYEPATGARNEATVLLYFSGEAALALAKLAKLDPDPRWKPAAARALAWLTGGAYANFPSQFFYGEDHWTCIAADEAVGFLDGPARDAVTDFCEGYAAFNGRSQFRDGDPEVAAQPDLAGSYGFTPLMPPHPTPVGSRAESITAAFRLAERRGDRAAAARIRAQLIAAYRFLLAHQLRDDGAWLVRAPAAARGAWLMSDVKRSIRIDFVQHAGAALLAGEPLAED